MVGRFQFQVATLPDQWTLTTVETGAERTNPDLDARQWGVFQEVPGA